MKIAFLGTPEFALPSLSMLIEEGHELAVFTQPDRPKDRGRSIAMPPVKELALAHGVPVYQFERIRDEEGLEALRAFAPDLMVTAAFGQILSSENLSVPRYGCINVHGSLLPKYRGAAPIQWAIINGESVTGVTTMMTDVGLDTGDMLLKCETEIGEDETAGELYAFYRACKEDEKKAADTAAKLTSERYDTVYTGMFAHICLCEALGCTGIIRCKSTCRRGYAESLVYGGLIK